MHGENTSRHAKIRRYNAPALLSSGTRARDIEIVQEQNEKLRSSLLPRSISLTACSPVPRFATYINNGREYSESEDTLLLPSESEALSDMRWYRDDRRVFQGRLPWRYELAPRYHGGAAWNIHPLASFPRFPPLPSSFPPPLLSFSRAFSLFLYVSLSFTTAALRVFLPRIHTYSLGRPPYALPCAPSLFLHPCRPYRIFCSQADSPMEATVVVA